ncbi:hypothetical protein AB4865_05850 [Capnocytophaga sp. ARDL2]|uniref:hypothetical protein n=1 Tax=Capnocytophaga sp. ARDL2 TaxID=3238809 RepID=UPI003556C58A
MKKIYKLMIYKIYRIALKQNETVPIVIGFTCFMSIFELIHIVIALGFVEILLNVQININSDSDIIFKILFITLGIGLNYFLFLKNKWIYKLNERYSSQNRNKFRDNLTFGLYLLFLVFCIVFITWINENK